MFYLKLGTHTGTLDKILAGCGLVAGFLFGGWHQLLTILIFIQLLDIISGLVVAIRNRNLASKRMREGITTKVGYWILVILAHIVDIILFDGQMIAQTAVLFTFIGTEGLSILENLGELGIIVPKFIVKYLEQVRGKGDVKEINIGKVPEPQVIEQQIVKTQTIEKVEGE